MLKYLLVLIAAFNLNAQDVSKKPQIGGPDRVPPHLRPKRPTLTEEQKKQRDDIIKKYDIDKNGKLNDDERKKITREDARKLRGLSDPLKRKQTRR